MPNHNSTQLSTHHKPRQITHSSTHPRVYVDTYIRGNKEVTTAHNDSGSRAMHVTDGSRSATFIQVPEGSPYSSSFNNFTGREIQKREQAREHRESRERFVTGASGALVGGVKGASKGWPGAAVGTYNGYNEGVAAARTDQLHRAEDRKRKQKALARRLEPIINSPW